MGNQFLCYDLEMPLTVFPGATDAENDVPGSGVDVLLKLLDAGFNGAQQTILPDDVQEFAAV